MLKQQGDTIVEVLFALAVLAAVLGGAYVSSNRSLAGARDAQERSEAMKLVEQQLERLRVYAAAQTINTTPFCLDPSNNRYDYGASSLPELNPDSLTISGSTYKNECVSQGRYYLSIVRDGPDQYKYTARTRWFKLGSSLKNEVKIVYRAPR